jgi:hypothetical protein
MTALITKLDVGAMTMTTLLKERQASLEWAIDAAATKGYIADADVLRGLLSELLSASKPAAIEKGAEKESNAEADLAFSVYSGLNALRWLLNITTEVERKDVRTRQAARLLDEYMDSFSKTNRERLEDMWKTLHDKLPDDGRISEYLRAHDAAGRELKTTGASK